MGKRITADCGLTIGLDLGDRFTEGRVLDDAGEIVEAFRVRTTEPALSSRLASFPSSRVVLEVGTHSPWVSRVVTRSGHEAIVANPRRVRLIAENDAKSDGVDAELLARLGRVDPSLLRPIVHRGAQAQRDRMLIQVRDGFVRARTQLVNQVRGFAKALGTRMPSSSTEAFPKRVRATTPLDLFPGLETSFGPDTDLRRAGLRMAERGGQAAKKRAIVATARRLAVLLHRLWVTGEVYEPLRSERTVAA